MAASDFTWFPLSFDSWLIAGVTITLVSGTADELAAAYAGDTIGTAMGIIGTAMGIHGVEERVLELNHPVNLVGVTAAGPGWALAVEVGGLLGIDAAVNERISAGRDVIEVGQAPEAVGSFSWVRDGQRLLWFDPIGPGHRVGTEADKHTAAMTAAGFDLEGEHEYDPEAPGALEKSLALAESITGVELTQELFELSPFDLLLVPRS